MTNLAIWFQQSAMPYILTFATTMAALLTALAPILVAVRKLRKNSDAMTKSNASVLAENALIKAENSEYKSKIARAESDQAAIKEMLRIALTNDPYLVANGYAELIAAACQGKEINKSEEVNEGEKAEETDEPKN